MADPERQKDPQKGTMYKERNQEMLGSMYSAVSGLAAHQTKMNVIGNNIANVNTYGYKSSRVTFSDVFYQTISSTSAPTTNTGGTNATQLGYGAKVNSIDVINTQAGSATTDRAMDVYINGEGYLAVKDGDGAVKYTRVGVLGFDVAGNLVDANGNMVLGIPTNSTTGLPALNDDGTVDTSSLVAIQVLPATLEKYSGIAIGQNGEISAIAEGDPAFTPSVNTSWLSSSSISEDSLYTGKVTIQSTVTAVDTVSRDSDGNAVAGVTVDADANIIGRMSVNYDGTAYTLNGTDLDGEAFSATGTYDAATDTVSFEVDGLADAVTVDATQYTFATGTNNLGNISATQASITASAYLQSGSTLTIGPATWTPATTSVTMGDLTLNISADTFEDVGNIPEGTLLGSVGNGASQSIRIATIACVKFANADGLSQSGEGYFLETLNSGEAVGVIPGSQGTGSFRSGALEMSNVDLSKEFTEMIITQRGFQANTRMITVSDSMLEELVNMKR